MTVRNRRLSKLADQIDPLLQKGRGDTVVVLPDPSEGGMIPHDLGGIYHEGLLPWGDIDFVASDILDILAPTGADGHLVTGDGAGGLEFLAALPWTSIDWSNFDIDDLTPYDLSIGDVLTYDENGWIEGIPGDWDGTPGNVILRTDNSGNILVSNLMLPNGGLVDGIDISGFWTSFINHATADINSGHSGYLEWPRLDFTYSDILNVLAPSGPSGWLVAGDGAGGLEFIEQSALDVPLHDLGGIHHSGNLPWTRVNWLTFDIDYATINDLVQGQYLLYGNGGYIEGRDASWYGVPGNTLLQTDSSGNIMVSNLLIPAGGLVDGVDVSGFWTSFANHITADINDGHSGFLEWYRIDKTNAYATDLLGTWPWSRLTFTGAQFSDIPDDLPWSQIDFFSSNITDVKSYGNNGQLIVVGPSQTITYATADDDGTPGNVYMRSSATGNLTINGLNIYGQAYFGGTVIGLEASDISIPGLYGDVWVVDNDPAYRGVAETPTWLATTGNRLLRTSAGKIRLQTLEAYLLQSFGDLVVADDVTIGGYLDVTGKVGLWWDENFTAGSGWSRTDAQMKRFGDHIFLRGRFTRSSGTRGTVATLPTGFRPFQELNLIQAGTGYNPIHVRITTGGNIIANVPSTNPQVVYLDGIVFSNNGEEDN